MASKISQKTSCRIKEEIMRRYKDQHICMNQNTIRTTLSKIARYCRSYAASITADEDVLEIGTGRCAITPLLGGKSVTTYETDKNMHSKAISVLKKYPNIKPICGDGFKSVEMMYLSLVCRIRRARAIEWLVQKKFSRASWMSAS